MIGDLPPGIVPPDPQAPFDSGRNPQQRTPRAFPIDTGPCDYIRPDAFIVDDLAKALALDPEVNSSDLSIECKGGVVKVTGRVSTVAEKARVETIIGMLFGIKDGSASDVVVSKDVSPPVQKHGKTQGSTGKDK